MLKSIYFTGLLIFVFHAAGGQNDAAPLKVVDCTFVGSTRHVCDVATFGKTVLLAKKVAVIAIEATPTWADLAHHLDPEIPDREYNDLRRRYFSSFVAPRIDFKFRTTAFEEFKKLTNKPSHGWHPPTGVLSRSGSGGNNERSSDLRKYAEQLLDKWGRFSIIVDPELADLVLEVRHYRWFGFDTGEDQLVSFILVWPRDADPKTDKVIWLEKYQGKWKRSDTVAGVFRSFRKSVEQAQRQAATRTQPQQ